MTARQEQQIKCKIGEAKRLCPRNGSRDGLRDVFCAISLDREEIYRTATGSKTLDPFFGEEFEFEVPRSFRYLSFYLYDRESSSKDKVIGKVAIKRDELARFDDGKDHWFDIKPVDDDSEVQGKIELEIKTPLQQSNTNMINTKPGANSPDNQNNKLQVRVIGCADLAIIDRSCDPFVIVSLYHNGTLLGQKRTKTKKKTESPKFDETISFDLPASCQLPPFHQTYNNTANHFSFETPPTSPRLGSPNTEGLELRVSVMHDATAVFPGSSFLGEVRIPLREIDLCKGQNAWYLLKPRRNINEKGELGSLRLRIHYSSVYVFDSLIYEPLRKLILESHEIKPIISSTAYVLGEVASTKGDAAQPLVKLCTHHRTIVPLIKRLADWEISKTTDPNTLFRGNTLVSKCMDELMKLIGIKYLHETLRGVIDEILTEHKPCEIDPSKLRPGENLTTNLENLRFYVETAFNAITRSAILCPRLMCEVFAVLKELAMKYFPQSREVWYNVISGFIFLRFFAPAILNPKLFELTDQPIDSQSNRTLTLISKTVQSIGNLVSSKNYNPAVKECYMRPLYSQFLNEAHARETRVFLEIISSSAEATIPRPPETVVILKESVMIKRTQRRRKTLLPLHLPTMQPNSKRYFCLTTHEFYYSKRKGSRTLCSIPINEILAVERLQEQSFKMKNMFQVVRKDRPLYIQANNCVEEKEWLDILTKVCQTNRDRLKQYHPSAYKGNKWLCCDEMDESAAGCQPITVTSVPADIHIHIDPDREVERIHSIFFSQLKTLDQLVKICETRNPAWPAQPGQPGQQQGGANNGSNWAPEQEKLTRFVTCTDHNRSQLWESLRKISSCVAQLERSHQQFLRVKYNRTKYGSSEAPIGDDNYLLMLAKHGPKTPNASANMANAAMSPV